MSVNVTFAKLFDRASEQGFADKETGVGAFEVKELKADSSPVPMKLLRVEQKDAEFTSFNHCLVEGMKDLTETRTSIIRDLDCDGVAFVEHDSQEGLIFTELKSRFSTGNIEGAFGQMFASFLKMHSMLSLCKDYSIDKISVHFIAACQCFEDDNQTDGVYNWLNKVESAAKSTFGGMFLRKLIEKHDIVVKFGDITGLWDLPLNESLTDKSVTLSLQMTQNYGDKSTVYNY